MSHDLAFNGSSDLTYVCHQQSAIEFRWEDQFNLSLDPETAREFQTELSLPKLPRPRNFVPCAVHTSVQ
jgi:thiamine biosynthesis protein ThiC